MPRVMLSTWPSICFLIAHEGDLGVIADGEGAHLGFLEVAGHPERVAVDHRDIGRAGVGVVADAKLQVGDVAVDRRDHVGAHEVDLGLIEVGERCLIGALRHVIVAGVFLLLLDRGRECRQRLAPRVLTAA